MVKDKYVDKWDLSVSPLIIKHNCMTYKDRCAESLISYKILHKYRKYMDNILLSFFSFHRMWLHTLPSGEGWFMRHMPVFSWLVWLHSQLSGTQTAKVVKVHTCTELLEHQMKHRQRTRKQVIWGSLVPLIDMADWLIFILPLHKLYLLVWFRSCSKHGTYF